MSFTAAAARKRKATRRELYNGKKKSRGEQLPSGVYHQLAMMLSIKMSSVAEAFSSAPRRPLIGRPLSLLPFSLPPHSLPPQSRLLKKQLVRRGRGEAKGREESGRITPLLSASSVLIATRRPSLGGSDRRAAGRPTVEGEGPLSPPATDGK